MDFLLSLWLMLFSQTIQTKVDKTTAYENVEMAIKREFGAETDLALKIAKCESNLNPKAINYNDALITGNPSWGVFQLNRKEFKGWDNFQINIKEAKKLYNKRKWQPWSCWKKLTF